MFPPAHSVHLASLQETHATPETPSTSASKSVNCALDLSYLPAQLGQFHTSLVAAACTSNERLALRHEFSNPVLEPSFGPSAPCNVSDPAADDVRNPLDYTGPTGATERHILSLEHLLENPGDQIVAHAKLQEDGDGPTGIGTDPPILAILERVATQLWQQCWDGEDEAIV